eukprot:scaffold3649_cov102-Skeletonema_dohrnii-CCMP3373.AAC.9
MDPSALSSAGLFIPPLLISIPTQDHGRRDGAETGEKIASQKTSIANLPALRSIVDETGLTSPETKARAQLIIDLSDNEEQLELLLESKREAAVVRLQDELHPPLDSEDCPICFETIKHLNCMTIVRCRGKMPIEGDYKEIGSMLLKHANKGRAWAQNQQISVIRMDY